MSLHKLTAGDGYAYLTRQVAAHDGTDRGYDSLGDYYAQKGETPGVWMGRGLAGLSIDSVSGRAISAGAAVSEAQMVALFGQGRHPDAELIAARMAAAGSGEDDILAATRLGRPFAVFEGATEFRRRVAAEMEAQNRAAGVARGAQVPAKERARIRTGVAVSMFMQEYGRLPLDDRERAGFLARISRQATTAVAGYDLTFSPVKSVSALWAIAPTPVSRVIEEAHRAAVADTLRWLEDSATFTRRGRAGVRQVDVTGLIAAAFEHRDSRAGDPDLHTHLAISNKVQALDGTWLALDGRPLHRMAVAASERYNTRIEAYLIDRLGVRFADRVGTPVGKRAVREIVAMPTRLLEVWSTRRAAIEDRRAALSALFQTEHGRPPSPVEAIHLAQQATLETRELKHEPRSLGEQRATWRQQAAAALGGAEQVDVMLATVLARSANLPRGWIGRALAGRWSRPSGPTLAAAQDRLDVPDEAWVTATASLVVQTVQAERATWQESHVRAEAERRARSGAVPLAVLDRIVDDVVRLALSDAHSIPLTHPEHLPAIHRGPSDRAPTDAGVLVGEPAALRRLDGTSVYESVGTEMHTSAQVLAAEQDLLALAGRRGAPALSQAQIEIALLESTANGLNLNPGQVRLVRELAGSGARLQLALAPAGTGKTTAMSVLARAWTAGGGNVVGLAPSAAAASVLREALPGAHTDTLAKYTHTVTGQPQTAVSGRSRKGRRRHRSSSAARTPVPDWVRQIRAGTLVVIDEAGMAGTIELAHAVKALTEAGAVVRLIGDDQQLAAVGAGGVLRDLAHEHGAATLRDVVRFSDPVEGAASLALRTGDIAAIGFYLDMERVHVGDASSAPDQAYAAWRADVAAGRDAVLLAPTHDLVTGLNARARADRLLAAGQLEHGETSNETAQVGRHVVLADGSNASAGDVIITRRNARRLMITSSDWVKNGYRWRVEAVIDDGSLQVRHLGTGRRITLPAEYVREHVNLGYASTIHAAQGLTADACHVVASAADLTRQLLYVALTRGRNSNHLYLDVAGDGDEHSVITRDALLPPSAADELLRILNRDGAQLSATTAQRELADPVICLQAAAARYQDALTVGAEATLGPDALADLTVTAEQMLPGLTQAPAWETLRAHLALLAVDGIAPGPTLRQAIAARELESANDPAAVLDWRLTPARQRLPGPLPWLSAIPAALMEAEQWGTYLRAREQLTRDLSAQVAEIARAWTTATAPAWARPILEHRQLVEDLAVWRAGQAIADSELAPAGPRPSLAAEVRHHKLLDAQVARVLGDPSADTSRWGPLVRDLAPAVLDDAFWPQLATRLENLSAAGTDIADLLCSVMAVARPLPDEHSASALWWRLARELTPDAMALADQPAPRRDCELVLALVPAGHEMHDPVRAEGPERPSPSRPTNPAGRSRQVDRSSRAAASSTGRGRAPAEGPLPPPSPAPNIEPPAQASPRPSRRPPTPATHDPNVTVERIAELNAQAAQFFTARYPHSWAPAYLRDRLNFDLTEPPADAGRTPCIDSASFSPGYAPAGWTTLVEYLRSTGARDDELLAAGLATRASTGRLIDRFRDRLVFPIYQSTAADPGTDDATTAPSSVIVGFVGRRNPDPAPEHAGPGRERRGGGIDPTDRHGPKYLNTAATALFDKSQNLFGFAQAAPALRAGAVPVLVEGPLDAIAVTLAGAGRYVGLASLGTAITADQIALLCANQPAEPEDRPSAEAGRRVLVATDADPAGQAAAEKAYWLLAAQGLQDVGHVQIPAGTDPAQLLADAGPQALRAAFCAAAPLADTLINDRIQVFADRLDTVEGRVFAVRNAAEVVATQAPALRVAAVSSLTERLHLLPQTVRREILVAVAARNDTPDPGRHVYPWAALVETVRPGLSAVPEWPALLEALRRAQASGHDVLDSLASCLDAPDAQPVRGAALELRTRLIQDCPAAGGRRTPPAGEQLRPHGDLPHAKSPRSRRPGPRP